MNSITKRTIDLIIFDQDGTLVDSRIDIANAVNYALKVLGLPLLDIGTITGYVGEGVTRLIEKALRHFGEPLEIDNARLLFIEYYSSHLTNNTYLYPGVVETLEYFREKRKAVISNKMEALTRDLLKDLGVLNHFEIVLGGDSTERKKPFPDPVLRVLRDLGINSSRALMVGDSPTDIEAGKGAGVLTCGVTYGYRGKDEILKAGPDLLIGSLLELKGLIE
jgi:phosphoglycolate phosphatase